MQIWSNPASAAGSLHLKGAIYQKKKKKSWGAAGRRAVWGMSWNSRGLMENRGKTAVRGGGEEEDEGGGRQTLRPPSTLVSSEICSWLLQGRAAGSKPGPIRVQSRCSALLSGDEIELPTDSFLCRRSGLFSPPLIALALWVYQHWDWCDKRASVLNFNPSLAPSSEPETMDLFLPPFVCSFFFSLLFLLCALIWLVSAAIHTVV